MILRRDLDAAGLDVQHRLARLDVVVQPVPIPPLAGRPEEHFREPAVATLRPAPRGKVPVVPIDLVGPNDDPAAVAQSDEAALGPELTADKKAAKIVFTIVEGPVYRVESVKINGNTFFFQFSCQTFCKTDQRCLA